MTPCGRDACRGKDCLGFDPKVGCKNKDRPPLAWARWYNEHDFTQKKEDGNEGA